MIGGLGSSKTSLVAILSTWLAYESPGVPGMVAAPTTAMLEDTDSVALEEFWEQWEIPFTTQRRNNALTYTLTECDAKVLMRSVDRPKRLRGPNLGWVLGDEIAQWDDDELKPQHSAVNILLGRIRHPKAKRHLFGVVGTPDGYNHLYARFAEPSGKRLLPNAWWTRAPTWENQYLDPGFVQSLKHSYDPLLYRQEVAGEFVNVGSSATYYAFSREMNLRPVTVSKFLPLVLCCDFNVNGVWVIAQAEKNGTINAVDEIEFNTGDATTIACEEFLMRYGGHPTGFEVYADRSGEARKTTGLSDFEVIRAKLGVYPRARDGANPPVLDRIQSVNTKLQDADGIPSLFVNDRQCPRLVRDLEHCKNAPGTRQPMPNQDSSLTHASDALGYYVHMRFPVIAGRDRWKEAVRGR